MTRTRPLTLLLFAALGGGGAWLLEIALVTSGATVAVPPVTLAIALALIGVIDIALALPIRRAVRDHARGRIDPFHATRVVVLAKASSIAGSLLAGAGIGILVFLLSRSVIAGVGSILMAVATTVGAIVLLVAGLVAEYLCSVPPDNGEEPDETPAARQP